MAILYIIMDCGVDIEYRLQNVLSKVKHIIEECEEEGLTNTQYFLDFETELNRWSVRDHNKENNFCKYLD